MNGRVLILSDGKPGHVNQSIAFAKHLGFAYDVCQVRFRNRWAKGISYIANRCGFRSECLFILEDFAGAYSAIVSAGSETYYANHVISQKLGIKSVAIMLPKGYRLDFDLIIAQQHDNPPKQDNVVIVPINLTYVEPQGYVEPENAGKYVSLIIGGNNRHSQLEAVALRKQIKQIFSLFPGYDFWLTTSRRTPEEIEAVLREFDFSWTAYYSQEQINPIADFLLHSDYVFLTADSTSMISEAVSYGTACVEVLPHQQEQIKNDKFGRFFKRLLHERCLHLFDGQLGRSQNKMDLSRVLKEIQL